MADGVKMTLLSHTVRRAKKPFGVRGLNIKGATNLLSHNQKINLSKEFSIFYQIHFN